MNNFAQTLIIPLNAGDPYNLSTNPNMSIVNSKSIVMLSVTLKIHFMSETN